MFYIYEWYIKDTGEIIYVGKGSKKRYLSKQHNNTFKEFIKRFNCESRIIEYFEDEQIAYEKEFERINELKEIGQCVCNKRIGGNGGGASKKTKMTRWTKAEREKYSKNNVMKSQNQRERMKKNNPMKNKDIALKSGKKHKRPIIINEKEYEGIIDVMREYKVYDNAIRYWIKRGYTNKNETIKFKYDNQQPSTMKFNNICNSEGSTTNK